MCENADKNLGRGWMFGWELLSFDNFFGFRRKYF